MRDFIGKAEEVAREHRAVFSAERGPIFSFDNAPIHQGANLRALNVTGAKRAPLPPSSPDMHKCIEHVFGTITRAMNARLHEDVGLTTAQQYRDEVTRLFGSVITPSSVQKDVSTLHDTYRAILDVQGDWPDRHLR